MGLGREDGGREGRGDTLEEQGRDTRHWEGKQGGRWDTWKVQGGRRGSCEAQGGRGYFDY